MESSYLSCQIVSDLGLPADKADTAEFYLSSQRKLGFTASSPAQKPILKECIIAIVCLSPMAN